MKYRTDEEISQNYDKILETLRADEIYVLSILPVSPKFKTFAKRIPGLNRHIKSMAHKHDCTYIDIYSKFVGTDGYIRKELTTDGVHPNRIGYEEFAIEIKGYL